MFFEYEIEKKEILKNFEFALHVSPHTYQRTAGSAGDFALHIMRIFMGKLGETTFSKLLLKERLIDSQDIKNMYEIWLGKTIADKYDFKVKYKLDVKTVFMSNHRNIIVPLDQWNTQPKEFYVGVKVDYGDDNFYNLHKTICKNPIELGVLEREGKEISQMIEQDIKGPQTKVDQVNSAAKQLQNKTLQICTFSKKINSQVLGYCPRKSQKWVNDPYSGICRENPCMRVHISLLEPVGNLLEILASK